MIIIPVSKPPQRVKTFEETMPLIKTRLRNTSLVVEISLILDEEIITSTGVPAIIRGHME